MDAATRKASAEAAEAAGYVAEAIAEALDFHPGTGWTAEGFDIGEIHFTDELGDKFILTVTKVEAFPGEEDGS